MKSYKNLIEAINDLRKRGYEEDLEIKDGKVNSVSSNFELHPEQFTIDEVYRFEGETNPDDSSVIYAISSQQGKNGILVDAYGTYAENMTSDLASKLNRS